MSMRAVVYDKPFSVSVQKVKKPVIEHPDDIIVKGEYLPVIHRVEHVLNVYMPYQ